MNVEQRLDRLEKQNRWLKCGAASLLAVVTAVGLLGAGGQTVAAVLQAREFVVIGDDGTPLAWLGKNKHGGGALAIRNKEGRSVAVIESTHSGCGEVVVRNSKAQTLLSKNTLVRMTADYGDFGAIQVFTEDRGALVDIGKTIDGRGAIRVLDPSDKMETLTLTPTEKK